MLPAEQKNYRKGLTLGLTLAETFSVVVFILLLACSALLRFEQNQRNIAEAERDMAESQRDVAEAQRDTARADLIIAEEIIENISTQTNSWANADIWIRSTRELRDSIEVLLSQANNIKNERDIATRRAEEADSLLARNGVSEEVTRYTTRLAYERDSLIARTAESEQRFVAAHVRQDSLAEHLSKAEQIIEQLHSNLIDAGDLAPEKAENIMELAAQAADLRNSLATARKAINRIDKEKSLALDQRDMVRADLRIAQETIEALKTQINSSGNISTWAKNNKELRDSMDGLLNRIEKAEFERDIAIRRAEEADSLLIRSGMSEEMTKYVARLANERDSLVAMTIESLAAKARQDSLAEYLSNAERVIERLRNDLIAAGDLTPERAQEVMELAAQTADLRDSLAIARKAIQSAERDKDDAFSRAKYWEDQIQGIGIDPPPCWMDIESNPEYIFRVELVNDGMRLYKIAPGHRIRGDREAISYAEEIEEGRAYEPEEFLHLTQPLYALGVSRTQRFGPMGCRFWVQPVDLTDNQKKVFQERQDQLGRRFWFRWP